jgi:hypothetical protein
VNGVDFIVQVCHTFRLKNKMHYVLINKIMLTTLDVQGLTEIA